MVYSLDNFIKTLVLSEDEIDTAVDLLRSGQIIAFPTETVYGLGAPIFDQEAIKKIFIAKGRPSDNPLIAHVSSMQQIESIATNIPDVFQKLYERFFPGPLTVVLSKKSCVPSIVSGGLETIAFRMPSHPIAKSLIEKLAQPIVAPSANISGRPSATSFEHVLEDFDKKIAAVIKGASSEIGIESTVISLLGQIPVILRPGSITQEMIEDVIQQKVEIASSIKDKSHPVLSPGMKYRHYSPKCPVLLFANKIELSFYLTHNPHKLRMVLAKDFVDLSHEVLFYELSSKNLYASLRYADNMNVDEVLILCDKNISSDIGLLNRIEKAAGKI